MLRENMHGLENVKVGFQFLGPASCSVAWCYIWASLRELGCARLNPKVYGCPGVSGQWITVRLSGCLHMAPQEASVGSRAPLVLSVSLL